MSGVYGYDIYYNRTNYELTYTVEYLKNVVVVVIIAGTRENFYDQLKQYIRKNQVNRTAACFDVTGTITRTPNLYSKIKIIILML